MKKKALAMFISICLVASLWGCGQDGGKDKTSDDIIGHY